MSEWSARAAGLLRAQPRIYLYFGLSLGLAMLAARPWLLGIDLFPGASANAVYESQSAMLLILVGAVSVLRWSATSERGYLWLALAVLPSSVLQLTGCVIDVTDPASRIFAGNRDEVGFWVNHVESLVLSAMFFAPSVRRWREGRPVVLALIAVGLTTGLLALTPLAIATGSGIFDGVADALSIVLFAGALVHILRQGEWAYAPVARGLFSATVVLLVNQVAYSPFATAREGDFVTASDLFKLAAATILTFVGVHELHRVFVQAVQSAKLLGAPNNHLLDAVVDLKAADDAKGRFLAMMSHELRTPLNGILGYAQLLRKGIAGALAERQLKYVDRIQENGDELLGLIESLLDAADVGAEESPLPVSAVSVLEAVKAAWSDVANPAERKGIRLATVVGDDVNVSANSAALGRVLRNLFANAVKYTPSGGHVSVSATRSGELVEIVVADDGIGIAEDQQKRIFERFTQVSEGRSRSFSGAGLGLAVSRHLLTRMGGRILVRSRLGGGSEFVITLLAAPSPEPARLERAATAHL
jgi:signal transduction histidine kinase